MRVRDCLFFAFALLGCSSKSDEPANNPATDSGTVEDTKQDALPPAETGPIYPEVTCGPGPYVDEELKVYGQTIASTSKDTPNKISFTLSACPEVKGTTDDEGYAVLHMTIGKPSSIRLESDGFVPTRWYERTPRKDEPSGYYMLVSNTVKTQLEGLDKGMILVDVYAPATSTTCTADGVSFTVEGHPEAVVKYRAATAPYAPVDAATSTTAVGVASISGITGLAAGDTVKVVGTKAGCDVLALAAPGGVALEAGVVSRVEMVVRDPHASCGPPPWVLLEGTVANREMDGTAGAPIENVTIDMLGCGSPASTKSDASGEWLMYVSTGLPVTRRASLTDYITSMSDEQSWFIDASGVNVALRKSADWVPLMPGYDTTHAYAIVGIAAPTSGTCAGGDGVVITVKGHPDAKVIYADGEPPKDTKGTATTKKGYAYVSGLTPGPFTADSITGTKGTNCKYSLAGGIDTGNAQLEAGALLSFGLYPSVAP